MYTISIVTIKKKRSYDYKYGLHLALPLTVGLAAVLVFIMSSPELQPNKITDDEDKN